eukprot:CAMPEP_0170480086 /NCGR_PEP_ID=MMETSP0208-20121228/1057_1 /TAXON_ID=197538 /ORGANISM="Strombidium inclinatum, Strain S3" /LENGTH=160 /DNA_ID=CAMNT_0010752569 /DNA_START=1070 /DNA_END=1552 /DNA_ORIENTATION=+
MGSASNNASKFINNNKQQQFQYKQGSIGRESLKSAGVLGFNPNVLINGQPQGQQPNPPFGASGNGNSSNPGGIAKGTLGALKKVPNRDTNYGGAYEDENPYLPYQNNANLKKAVGSNSSTMNSRITNHLQSSINSGLGGLVGNGAISSNANRARDLSGAS